MNILRVCQEYYPLISGPTKQAHNISRHLIARGHSSPVLTTTAGTDLKPGPDQIDDVPIMRVAAKGRIMRCYFAPTLHRDLDLTHVDLVHIHGWRNYVSEYAMHRARRKGIPVVLHAHGGSGMAEQITSGAARVPYWAYDLLRRRTVIASTDLLVVSTAQERDESVTYGFPEARIAVVPAGIGRVHAPAPDSVRDPIDGPARLLFVGRLSSDRNLEQMIRAVDQLRDQGVAVVLRIVGREEQRTSLQRSGYVDAMRQLATELDLAERVVFVGERRGEALAQEYAAADIFISTSRYENFGNAILEAASYGIPLITTPTGVGPELIAATGAGVVVDIEDVVSTADACRKLIAQADRHNLGLRLQSHVVSRYSWSSIADQFISMYQQLIDGREFAAPEAIA